MSGMRMTVATAPIERSRSTPRSKTAMRSPEAMKKPRSSITAIETVKAIQTVSERPNSFRDGQEKVPNCLSLPASRLAMMTTPITPIASLGNW